MSPDDPTRSVPPDHTAAHVEPAGDRTLAQVTAQDGSHLPNVGGYIIERELGRGGMAIVYLAHQPGLNRPVAVKRIGGDGPPDDRAVIRFLAEAENVAAIRHPHVVQVYQFGQDDAGRPFLAMEYLPGGTLADKLRADEKLPPRTAAELLAAVSEGVAAAHALGIVHRDLKPGNVLLDAAGVPKVTDFGLAKRGPGAELTNTGAIMGTPAYMCPEQAGGRTKFVGPAGDVWAVGVMLYECLSGRRPFDADKSWDIIVQVVNAAPTPLRTVCPAVPRDLGLIVEKCLMKEPADRYPSALELSADLRAWLSGRPIAARPLPAWERGWRWAKRNTLTAGALTAAVVLLLAGTGVSVWQMLRANGEAARADDRAADAVREQKRAETGKAAAKASALEARRMVGRMAVAEGVRLADAGDAARALAWFARPCQVVLSASEDLTADRVASYRRYASIPLLTDVGALPGRPISRPRRAGLTHRTWRIEITNNAARMAFHAQVWDTVANKPITLPLVHAAGINAAAFSPDGRWVATVSNDRTARIWSALTGVPVTPSLPHTDRVLTADFSPDGRRLTTTCDDGHRCVWDAATCTSAPFLEHSILADWFRKYWTVVPSADGRRLAYFCSDQLARERTARVWDAATGRLLTPVIRLAGQGTSAAFSPDGQRLLTVAVDGTIQVWDTENGRQLAAPSIPVDSKARTFVVPDGRRLVRIGSDNTVRAWDTDTGGQASASLHHSGRPFQVVFSSDGRWLATSTSADGTVLTQMWDMDAGKERTPPLRLAGQGSVKAVSTDGYRVAIISGDHTVQVWDALSGRPHTPRLPHAEVVSGVEFSRDGRSLVTASFDRTVRVWDATSGQPVTPPLRHAGSVYSAVFHPNSRQLITACEDGKARIWDLPTDTRPTADLIKLAHLYAGGRIDDAGGFVPLTADETKTLFAELKAKYPADFTVTPAQADAWHRDQHAAAEADHDWFAARFHLNVLLAKYAFGDIDLAVRLHNTREPAPMPKPR